MFSLVKWIRSWLPSAPWTPLKFPTNGFDRIDADVAVEEERLPDYKEDVFYPVTIGEVLADRYQIVGKLGFGASSTVWLARDMK